MSERLDDPSSEPDRPGEDAAEARSSDGKPPAGKLVDHDLKDPPPEDPLPEDPLPEDELPEDDEPSALEESAQRSFSLKPWDRPELYRDTADAAIDADLPFWLVLLLSGAIASLGLLLNASAVVIGAMLVAPLLAPLLGLALGLAVGDGRLVVQTGVMVALGALGVILVGALLTAVLPFTTVTEEIASRTRPTTIDLGIAVFSGLAGAVVTISREKRLSASIPGVAIAVALIPPLSVAGFGIGTGWQWPIIRGSLLLFGANLGGIVLTGMLAFMLVGMHRADVAEAAIKWHRTPRGTGLARRVGEIGWVRRLGVLRVPITRVALVLAFCAAVAVPLSSSFVQIVREARVQQAVVRAVEVFDQPGRSSILNQETEVTEDGVAVYLQVATSAWYGPEERARFERAASTQAGEAVTLRLEQVLASAGAIDSLAAQLPRPRASEPASQRTLSEALPVVEERLAEAELQLVLPDSVRFVDFAVAVPGGGEPRLEMAYAAPQRLARETEQVLVRQAARLLGVPEITASVEAISLRPRPLDAVGLATATRLMARYPALELVVLADSARSDSLLSAVRRAGIDPDRTRRRIREGGPALQVNLPDR